MGKQWLPDGKSVDLADSKTKGFLIAFFCLILGYMVFQVTNKKCPDEEYNQKVIMTLLKQNQELAIELKVKENVTTKTPTLIDSLLREKEKTNTNAQ